MSMFDRAKNLRDLLDDVNTTIALRVVPVELIDPDPEQPRKEFSEATLDELGDSMMSEGQLQPVELLEKPDGRFLLVTGERRLRAALRKAIPELTAIVKPIGMGRPQIRRRQLIENLQRENMSAIDTARSIAELVEEEGSARAAAKAIGMGEAQVSKYLSILHLPPVAAELASITKDVETIATVAKIERQDAAAVRQLLVKGRATGKVSREEARKVAKQVAATAPTERKVEPKPQRSPETQQPQQLGEGERVVIYVKLKPGVTDDRFQKAEAQFGRARLCTSAIAQDRRRCWVTFGEEGMTPEGEGRLLEFDCQSLSVSAVSKDRAG